MPGNYILADHWGDGGAAARSRFTALKKGPRLLWNKGKIAAPKTTTQVDDATEIAEKIDI